jgi:hypothetical protein
MKAAESPEADARVEPLLSRPPGAEEAVDVLDPQFQLAVALVDAVEPRRGDPKRLAVSLA